MILSLSLKITKTQHAALKLMEDGDLLVAERGCLYYTVLGRRFSDKTIDFLRRRHFIARMEHDYYCFKITSRGQKLLDGSLQPSFTPTKHQKFILAQMLNGVNVAFAPYFYQSVAVPKEAHWGSALMIGGQLAEPAALESLRKQGLIKKIKIERSRDKFENGFTLTSKGKNFARTFKKLMTS